MPKNLINESTFIQNCAAGHNKLIVEALNLDRTLANIPTSDGISPLMMAAEAGMLSTVQLLIDNGANINAIHQRKSVLSFAASNNHWEIILHLLEKNNMMIEKFSAELELLASHPCFLKANNYSEATHFPILNNLIYIANFLDRTGHFLIAARFYECSLRLVDPSSTALISKLYLQISTCILKSETSSQPITSKVGTDNKVSADAKTVIPKPTHCLGRLNKFDFLEMGLEFSKRLHFTEISNDLHQSLADSALIFYNNGYYREALALQEKAIALLDSKRDPLTTVMFYLKHLSFIYKVPYEIISKTHYSNHSERYKLVQACLEIFKTTPLDKLHPARDELIELATLIGRSTNVNELEEAILSRQLLQQAIQLITYNKQSLDNTNLLVSSYIQLAIATQTESNFIAHHHTEKTVLTDKLTSQQTLSLIAKQALQGASKHLTNITITNELEFLIHTLIRDRYLWCPPEYITFLSGLIENSTRNNYENGLVFHLYFAEAHIAEPANKKIVIDSLSIFLKGINKIKLDKNTLSLINIPLSLVNLADNLMKDNIWNEVHLIAETLNQISDRNTKVCFWLAQIKAKEVAFLIKENKAEKKHFIELLKYLDDITKELNRPRSAEEAVDTDNDAMNDNAKKLGLSDEQLWDFSYILEDIVNSLIKKYDLHIINSMLDIDGFIKLNDYLLNFYIDDKFKHILPFLKYTNLYIKNDYSQKTAQEILGILEKYCLPSIYSDGYKSEDNLSSGRIQSIDQNLFQLAQCLEENQNHEAAARCYELQLHLEKMLLPETGINVKSRLKLARIYYLTQNPDQKSALKASILTLARITKDINRTLTAKEMEEYGRIYHEIERKSLTIKTAQNHPNKLFYFNIIKSFLVEALKSKERIVPIIKESLDKIIEKTQELFIDKTDFHQNLSEILREIIESLLQNRFAKLFFNEINLLLRSANYHSISISISDIYKLTALQISTNLLMIESGNGDLKKETETKLQVLIHKAEQLVQLNTPTPPEEQKKISEIFLQLTKKIPPNDPITTRKCADLSRTFLDLAQRTEPLTNNKSIENNAKTDKKAAEKIVDTILQKVPGRLNVAINFLENILSQAQQASQKASINLRVIENILETNLQLLDRQTSSKEVFDLIQINMTIDMLLQTYQSNLEYHLPIETKFKIIQSAAHLLKNNAPSQARKLAGLLFRDGYDDKCVEKILSQKLWILLWDYLPIFKKDNWYILRYTNKNERQFIKYITALDLNGASLNAYWKYNYIKCSLLHDHSPDNKDLKLDKKALGEILDTMQNNIDHIIINVMLLSSPIGFFRSFFSRNVNNRLQEITLPQDIRTIIAIKALTYFDPDLVDFPYPVIKNLIDARYKEIVKTMSMPIPLPHFVPLGIQMTAQIALRYYRHYWPLSLNNTVNSIKAKAPHLQLVRTLSSKLNASLQGRFPSQIFRALLYQHLKNIAETNEYLFYENMNFIDDLQNLSRKIADFFDMILLDVNKKIHSNNLSTLLELGKNNFMQLLGSELVLLLHGAQNNIQKDNKNNLFNQNIMTLLTNKVFKEYLVEEIAKQVISDFKAQKPDEKIKLKQEMELIILRDPDIMEDQGQNHDLVLAPVSNENLCSFRTNNIQLHILELTPCSNIVSPTQTKDKQQKDTMPTINITEKMRLLWLMQAAHLGLRQIKFQNYMPLGSLVPLPVPVVPFSFISFTRLDPLQSLISPDLIFSSSFGTEPAISTIGSLTTGTVTTTPISQDTQIINLYELYANKKRSHAHLEISSKTNADTASSSGLPAVHNNHASALSETEAVGVIVANGLNGLNPMNDGTASGSRSQSGSVKRHKN